jgi:hypothetical protein
MSPSASWSTGGKAGGWLDGTDPPAASPDGAGAPPMRATNCVMMSRSSFVMRSPRSVVGSVLFDMRSRIWHCGGGSSMGSLAPTRAISLGGEGPGPTPRDQTRRLLRTGPPPTATARCEGPGATTPGGPGPLFAAQQGSTDHSTRSNARVYRRQSNLGSARIGRGGVSRRVGRAFGGGGGRSSRAGSPGSWSPVL